MYGLAACAFLGLALSDALGLQGAARLAVCTAAIAMIGAINAVGVRHGLRFAVATTVAKMVPLALVIIGGAFAMRAENLRIRQ
jgi:amino acid transporter